MYLRPYIDFSAHAVSLADRMVGVRQQREVQFVFVAEIPVRLFAVGAYADDAESHPGQFGLAVAQALASSVQPEVLSLG